MVRVQLVDVLFVETLRDDCAAARKALLLYGARVWQYPCPRDRARPAISPLACSPLNCGAAWLAEVSDETGSLMEPSGRCSTLAAFLLS